MFAGVVWLAYTQGVARGRGETPVLTAAAGPERVAPPSSAGGAVPYQGFKIYEQPAPSDDEVADAPLPQQAAPQPVTSKPAPRTEAPAAPKPAPATAMAPPPPAAKPAPAAAPPKSVAGLIQQANSGAEPAKPAAPAKPANPPVKQAVIPPPVATGAPRQLGVAAAAPSASAPKVAAATPAPAPVTKPAGGGFVLQIGAYKSQADAKTAWADYKRRHAALLAGYSDDIQQADLGERGTWFRLRIGGLADREVAVALCDRLKADGGACILGR